MRFIRSLICCIVLFNLACESKEEEDLLPQLSWESPQEMQLYNVKLPIPIRAIVSDDKSIQTISISLNSSTDNRRIGSSVIFHPNARTYQLSTDFFISDTSISSGPYFIEVRVSDEQHSISFFRSIQIAAIPKRKLGIIVATTKQLKSQYVLIDSNLQTSNFALMNGRAEETIFHFNEALFWHLSKDNTQILSYNYHTGSMGSSIQAQGARNLNLDMELEGQRLYFGSNQGQVQYSLSNSISNVYQSPSGYTILNFGVNPTYLILNGKINGQSNYQVKAVFTVSGAQKFEINIPRSADFIFFSSNETALLFSEDSNGLYIQELNLNTNAIRQVKVWSNIHVNDIVQVGGGNYIFAADEGLYAYENRTISLRPLDLNGPFEKCAYEVLENEVIYSHLNDLYSVGYGTAARNWNISLADTIRTISPWYNR